VGGLVVSSPVTINGFQVGQVSDIQLYDPVPGSVVVTFIVTNDDLEFSDDTQAHIESLDFLGSKTVSLKLGSSDKVAESGDTLTVSIEIGLMDEVNRQLAPLKLKTESLIASVDSVMAVTNALLREDARPNLKKSFESIRRTLESIEHTSESLDGLLMEQKGRLASILVNVESLTGNLSESNQDLTNIIKNFSSISDSLVKADVANVVGQASEAISSTALIMDKINKGEGSLGLLLNDDSLYNHLNTASDNLDALLEDIRLNPKRYVSFSLIERKDGELKLGRKDIEKIREELNKE
jgi:phospholipid/cholesterol/gamma-HCH transport system substrate-binding protein